MTAAYSTREAKRRDTLAARAALAGWSVTFTTSDDGRMLAVASAAAWTRQARSLDELEAQVELIEQHAARRRQGAAP